MTFQWSYTHTHTASHTKTNLEIRGLPEASNKSTHRCSDLALVSLYHLSRPLGKICFLQHTESPSYLTSNKRDPESAFNISQPTHCDVSSSQHSANPHCSIHAWRLLNSGECHLFGQLCEKNQNQKNNSGSNSWLYHEGNDVPFLSMTKTCWNLNLI